ncbi:GSCOCG00011207001-RA-CDS, partial [Cotesia congregata]
GISEHVPVYTNNRSEYPRWFSKELIRKIKLEKQVHKNYKKYRSYHTYKEFQNIRKECKSLSIICYNNYDSNIPSTMNWSENTANTGEEVSNLFASYFKSMYMGTHDSSVNQVKKLPTDYDANLFQLEVRYDDVLKVMKKLNDKKGAGPDGIPNLFLKNCAIGLCEPITHIFHKSVEEGVFPSEWKLSYICPIYKSGSKSSIINYHPVCIQSSLAKLFEKLVLPQLISAFKNIISTRQHGFISGRSTTTNLYIYTDYIYNALNHGFSVHALYTDFSKAFDTVNHDILVEKLKCHGVTGKALNWFQSYLTGRSLQVRVNGYYSKEYEVNSGVPQGSHLGPVLFNIFINDIADNLSSEYLLYADDMKIYRKINTENDIRVLQQDLDKLYQWCLENKLKLNIDKCAVMMFNRSHGSFPVDYNINGQPLPKPPVMKDLGVLVDIKLS